MRFYNGFSAEQMDGPYGLQKLGTQAPGLRGRDDWHGSDGLHGTVPGAKRADRPPLKWR